MMAVCVLILARTLIKRLNFFFKSGLSKNVGHPLLMKKKLLPRLDDEMIQIAGIVLKNFQWVTEPLKSMRQGCSKILHPRQNRDCARGRINCGSCKIKTKAVCVADLISQMAIQRRPSAGWKSCHEATLTIPQNGPKATDGKTRQAYAEIPERGWRAN